MIDSGKTEVPSPEFKGGGAGRHRLGSLSTKRMWLGYGIAVVGTAALLVVRMWLGYRPGDSPALILFLFPVMLSAYVGGVGPGLVSTALGAFGASYFLLPPRHFLSIETQMHSAPWLRLVLSGCVVSILSEASHRQIAERLTAEEKLRASEERLGAVLGSATDGIVTVDERQRITFFNPAAEKMFKCSATEANGQPLDRFIPERFRSAQLEHIRTFGQTHAARGALGQLGSVYGLRSDGEEFPLEASISQSEMQGQKLFTVILRDVTERQRAEQKLRQVNRALRTISECNQVLVRVEEESQLLNDVCEVLVGAGGYRMAWVGFAENDEGKSVRPAAHAGIEERYLQGASITWADTEGGRGPTGTAIRTGKPVVARDFQADSSVALWREEALKRGYASSISLPILLNGHALGALTIYAEEANSFDSGEILLLTELSNDLAFGIQALRARAERQRVEEAIVQSEERYRTLFENAPLGIYRTTPEGHVMAGNPAFVRMLGYSSFSEMARRDLNAGGFEPEYARSQFMKLMEDRREIVGLESTWSRRDGSALHVRENARAIRDDSGKILYYEGTVEDITERRTLEEQLQRAAKMEAIGRLAGGVAHDFNNLLTIINGYAELLIDKFAADNEVGGQLKQIYDAGERAASLTRQLLAFSRSQVLAPQVLDLNAVVSNVEKMLRRLIGEDIELRTVLDPALGRVKADPGQIEQVIMNLAANARDAMPKGGKLTLETRSVDLDEAFARNHVTVKPGPHVMLAVADTGTGMTDKMQARIFEPFFTTKELGKGTGLGLATVYGIVKQSGGSIWVYSELGQGTVFKVFFPTVGEDLPPSGPAKSKPDSASGSETELLVEDEEGVRSLVRHALETSGYKVLETDDAESALVTCANHEGPIHLLLTDVVMPQMSGPVVAESVVALRPDIKVLYMSGYTDDTVVHHGMLSQDMTFIQKPFSPVALRKKIREVLGGKT